MDNDNTYLKEIKINIPRVISLFDNDETSDTCGIGDRYYGAWSLIDFSNVTFQGAVNGLARLWVNNNEEVLNQCIKWDASYALITQETNTLLNSKWLNDFEQISVFDWGLKSKYLTSSKLWPKSIDTPKWFLLKRK